MKDMAGTGSAGMRWAGRLLTGLAALFFLADGAMKLAHLPQVIDTTRQLGWPVDPGTLRTLGTIQIVAALLYLWPRTAFPGAILLTGYLGGAVATHMRIASPLFSHILFGVYVGIAVWGGLWFRMPAVRALLPLARDAER